MGEKQTSRNRLWLMSDINNPKICLQIVHWDQNGPETMFETLLHPSCLRTPHISMSPFLICRKAYTSPDAQHSHHKFITSYTGLCSLAYQTECEQTGRVGRITAINCKQLIQFPYLFTYPPMIKSIHFPWLCHTLQNIVKIYYVMKEASSNF